MKITFNGLISENASHFDETFIGNDRICEELFYNDIILNGDKINVKYFISDIPIIDEGTAQEQYLLQIVGACEGEYHIKCGSEWTGVYGIDEMFNVNGHDLLSELRSNMGKYCLLIIYKIEDDEL